MTPGVVLGLDTSNYTTSAAVFDPESGVILQRKQLLPVKEGVLGLRQSDALFHHVRQLSDQVRGVMAETDRPVAAVCVSDRPRGVEGSYMPCFLAGKMAAECIGAALRVPVYYTSHQAGHVVAALYSAGKLELLDKPFLAFHVSGGTFEGLRITPDQQKVLSAEILAHTLDISPGQLIDRTGVRLGLPFPAGPHLERLAEGGHCGKVRKPVLKDGCCCLSGMENQVEKMQKEAVPPADIACYIQTYLAGVLTAMADWCLERTGPLPVLYSGGVMSNRFLRERLAGPERYFAQPAFSADNACGVALLGGLLAQREVQP